VFYFSNVQKNTFGMLLQSLWIKAYDMTKCKCNKEMNKLFQMNTFQIKMKIVEKL